MYAESSLDYHFWAAWTFYHNQHTVYLYILCWSLMAIYIYHQRYLIHRVVLWDAKLSHVMADYFLFIRFFRADCFFLSSRRLMILVCMYDIHTMLTCTYMSQIVTHVTIWKYRMINKIYLRSLYMEPYFVISWFSLTIRSCIIDFLYEWIITQDQIFNF